MKPVEVDCIYINGDSWAYGSELRDQQRLDVKDDFAPVHDQYRQLHNWAGLLGKYYNLPVINSAWAGGSNQRIVRTALADITDLICKKKRPFVIIAWTQLQRFELFNNATGFWQDFVGPLADNSQHPIANEIWGKYSSDASDLTQYLQQIILMDAFLKQNRISYIGTNVFRHNWSILEDHAHDPQFASHFWQITRKVGLDQHLYNASISQMLAPHVDVTYGPGGHPLELGQQYIADYFKTKIDSLYQFKTPGTR